MGRHVNAQNNTDSEYVTAIYKYKFWCKMNYK